MSLVEILRLSRRFGAPGASAASRAARFAVIALIHLAALVIMALTEIEIAPKLIYLFTWGLFNFFWLALLRRPALSAALSLTMLVVLILLSQLKYDILWMTVNFVDVMIIDRDAISFLLGVIPDLSRKVALVLAVLVPTFALVWWIDPFRVRRLVATGGVFACLVGLIVTSFAFPQDDWQTFLPNGHVSKFSRSGVVSVSQLILHGMLESDAVVTDHLRAAVNETCGATGPRPNIILVHDESSFDVRAAPGVKVPAGYGAHFVSFDGKRRHFVAEGTGGPSWYAEYNVFSGLSARSFGQFSYFVTRIAAGHVLRGLPQSLRRCGYQTLSLYPALGAFMGARNYQTSSGVQHFFDSADLGTEVIEPDRFFYDKAVRLIARERGEQPLFMFVYLAANHYPWDYRYRPDLAPAWHDPGNMPRVDEYLRRQSMSAGDYNAFLARLKREFPTESFLIFRYGDHQPDFAAEIIDPSASPEEMTHRFMSYDPRYFTTYYAIDTINYKPADLTDALDTLEGPYLPLVMQEAAGLPLDPSFIEQKKILQRCRGAFYLCADGAEARRFNRLLIDAGLITGL